ncbi:MAG: iron-sulfur cluster repair di-iron protein [Polyangiales bacterium]
MLDRQQSVASLVLDHSECAAVFQKHRIDFCCRGAMTIEDAAKEKKLDVDVLATELERAMQERTGAATESDPRTMSTPALIAKIMGKHHEYLRKVLPFLVPLAAKVGRVHGDHNPKLRELDVCVSEISKALLAHLDEEEQAVFPALMARGTANEQSTKLLTAMMDEHLTVASLLERIRAATDEFTLPDWACNSYRTLFKELAAMESDIFQHVHLENHVLAPRFGVKPPTA